MNLRLYNTRSHRLEPFTPRGTAVTCYVCGITPYDTTHLGHAFTYTTVDILIRYLEFRGYTVRYAQNVTDIDDDILKKAGQVGQEWRLLGNRWTVHFIEDMKALNVRPPDYFPRATDVIPEIIAAVQALLAAGVAYESAGNVYFHVASWPEFGKLSQLPREQMLPIANERGNHPDDPHKQDPLDFVLWQAQAQAEPAWDSPWGPGRPGWHIECSTMATRLLGNTIDLHGGGADLLFPHHECEIAQVESLPGSEPFVRTWLHVAMVHHQGEKMSKSLGNLIMVRNLLETWSPDALRLYLGRHHYRQAWAYDSGRLAQAQAQAQIIQAAAQRPAGNQRLGNQRLGNLRLHGNRRATFGWATEGCMATGAEPAASRPSAQAQSLPKDRPSAIDFAPSEAAFIQAMDNDLDTASALDVLAQLAQAIRRAGDEEWDLASAQVALRRMARVFGLRLDAAPEAEGPVTTGWNEHLRRFKEP